ncbi:THUMP domain-containing protein 2 isoform X2 [Pundamilia nyererei]|nr:PREDICTED: THUMP domain-containing protein 2 isoform X2 [Pundamilia nyererei]
MTWSRLQGELTGSKNTIKTSSPALGVTRKREDEMRGSDEQSREGEKSLVEFRSTGGERKEEIDKQRSGGQNGVSTMAQKRKRDEEEEERKVAAWDTGIEKTVEKGTACEEERTREEEAEGMLEEFIDCTHGAYVNGGGPVCDHTASRLEHRGASSSRKMDDIAKDFTEESQENDIFFSSGLHTGEKNQTLLTTCEDKPELLSCIPVSFRISCKCSGSLSRCLGAQEVSRVIGAGLSRLLGWKADLKNPQLEINVYLSDDYCLLGIPLTRLPLANRSYIKITGLRSTTAWAMASLAHIQPGFRVVDPMCGVGTILIEAAQEHKDACFLGVDIDEAQLQKASENIAFAELENRINLLKASSLVLPVPSATVDAVICDLPFGRKFSSRIDMAANLPLILTEMERVLRPGGILVLLLSPQLSCLLKKLLIQYDTGPTSNPETKPQTGMQNCPSSSRSPSKKQTFQIHSGVKSSPSQETKLQHSLPFTVSSLKHQATFRVSLGAIDGLIHKYVKTDCCVFRDVMF